MKKWMKILPAVAAVLLVTTGITMVNGQAKQVDKNVIFDRIYVGEVAVGGLTQEQAEEEMDNYIAGLGSEIFTLSANEKTISVTGEQLGLSWANPEVLSDAVAIGKSGNLIARYKVEKDLENEDKVFPVYLNVDEDRVTAFLQDKLPELNVEAVDYDLTREDGEFKILGGVEGVDVNVEESVAILEDYFSENWHINDTIDLAVQIAEPQGSEEELSKVKDVLGTYTTGYSSSASGRKTNVKNGCNFISGTLLYPGETFSVYATVSPFTAANGYALAGAYENGTTVDAYGGGICQVSTTLYNAVIRAELEVVERSGHSMLVAYVDPSADAAIAGEYKDFKFKNNSEYPIYIDGYADGANISFTIYGCETRPSNRKVSFVSETLSTTQPTTKYEATGDAIGYFSKTQSSHTGKVAQLWKIVTVDGVEESREVFNKTTYNMSPNIYSVGTGSSSAEATAAMKSAIASQNEGTIKSAISQWSASALEKKQKEEEEQKKKEEEEKKKQEEAAAAAAAAATETPAQTEAPAQTETPAESEAPSEGEAE